MTATIRLFHPARLILVFVGSIMALTTGAFSKETEISDPAASFPVRLLVQESPSQTLKGFGCSLVDFHNIPDSACPELFDKVFGVLRMNILRLWVESGQKSDLATMKQAFLKSYGDPKALVENARKRGVDTFLLAPARGESSPQEPVSEYAHKLGAFIELLKNELGVEVQATGIANEPLGFTPEQVAETVRTLRADLDERGFKSIGIIAPESASADSSGLNAIRAIRADPAAWTALRGIATHSYNMAATPQFASLLDGTDKEYWMTESSDNGYEGLADANRASSELARFLNDLNNGVTHWIWFIGFYESPGLQTDLDNATKLIVYDRLQGKVVPLLKYDWFRQARAAFPSGSRIYRLRAEPGGELVFTYGKKPILNAAAAQRPDGGWSLGVVNLTGVEPDTSICQFHPAAPLEITWEVPALADVPKLNFEVQRSSATERFSSAGIAVMRNGKLTLPIAPRQLITLTSK